MIWNLLVLNFIKGVWKEAKEQGGETGLKNFSAQNSRTQRQNVRPLSTRMACA